MGGFFTTLFILKQDIENFDFVEKLNQNLNNLSFSIEKENTVIVFNEGPNGECFDEVYLDESFSDYDVLVEIKKWKFLGIIEYSSKDLNVQISVNVISFNGSDVSLFDIAIPKVILRSTEFEDLYKQFINELAKKIDAVRYCGNSSDIVLNGDIELLHSRLNQSNFDFDIRL